LSRLTPDSGWDIDLVKVAGGRVGKTGVMADRDKIEFRLFNSSSN